MYAVIQTGGKQYKVAEGDRVQVERDVLAGVDGDKVKLDVLMLGGDNPQVGTPLVSGASVEATVVGERQGEKITVFRKKRRQHHIKRKQGHRQQLVELRIDSIKS